MKAALKYIELKSGFSHSGEAWIGLATLSKSGKTLYFNDKALKKGAGIISNYWDLETGDEYWVSNVKKNGQDRHWAGGGKVMIARDAIEIYLAEIRRTELDKKAFEIVDIAPTDTSRFIDIENTL